MKMLLCYLLTTRDKMASKQDLRRLMQKQKGSSKVNHPMAKYNNIGQLSCVICNIPVKSDLVWPAHLQSKRHKEAVVELKNNKSTTVKSNASSQLKLVPSPHVASKVSNQELKRKEKITLENSEISEKKSKVSALPADFFDSSSDKSKVSSTGKTTQDTSKRHSVLPADFFDEKSTQQEFSGQSEEKKEGSLRNTEKIEESNSKQESKSHNIADVLPEGFFDDPKQDAKVRKVEYVDPQEVEWEKFQKMVTSESKVSDNIIEGEEEESEMVKDLTELNKLKGCLSRVETLKERQDFLKRKKGGKKYSTSRLKEVDTTSSDEDLDEMFNWRAKKAV